tara:strand:+ start:27129 stop:27971 length:843 start_codon:yes stop_codon:yes gene_type:complete
MDDYIGVVVICGDEGALKTTEALSFPQPIVHFDIDVGGYRRASWRINTSNIKSKSYPKPIQLNKLMGSITDNASTRIQIPKKVEGMKELWQDIVTDYVAACQDPSVATIVLDSSTVLWVICHMAYLQELQEKQLAQHKGPNAFDENNYRERLQPIEYSQPNDRMRSLINTSRSFIKNLILTHYPTDEYGVVPDGHGGMTEGKTGTKVLDGFKETVKLADLVMWNRLMKQSNGTNIVVSKITKCGLAGMGLTVVGDEIEASYESLVNLRTMMTALVEASNA